MHFTSYEKTVITEAFKDTLMLLFTTGGLVLIFGLFIGLVLYFTETSETRKGYVAHKTFGVVIDIFRSIPFIILMIILIPFTVLIMNTMLGPKAAIPALVLSAGPFYGRIIYNALKEIPKGHIEAIKAMGANRTTFIVLLIKESLPSLIAGFTVTMVSLVGFIAAAGAVGAGGLGDLARRRALTMDYDMMYVSVVLLLVIVLFIQIIGDYAVKKIDKR
ncbi:MAG: ABC transporter permease subunit [Acholeplasma sp.]|nr:ABC transporter permease subunit [Acholeplasma sp.]